MQCQEARKWNGCKCVCATDNKCICHTGTDQLTCIGNTDRTCGTGITDICDNALSTCHICHMVCDRGDRHLINVICMLSLCHIIFHTDNTTDAASHDNTDTTGIALVNHKTGIIECFFRSLQAELADTVNLLCLINLIKSITVHFCTEVCITVGCIDGCHLINSGFSSQCICEALLHVISDCADHTKSGYNATCICNLIHYYLLFRIHRAAPKFSFGTALFV